MSVLFEYLTEGKISLLTFMLITGFVVSVVFSVLIWLLKSADNIYITITTYGISLCLIAFAVWRIIPSINFDEVSNKTASPLDSKLASSKEVINKNSKTTAKTKEKVKSNTANKQTKKEAERQAAEEAEEQMRLFNEQIKNQNRNNK